MASGMSNAEAAQVGAKTLWIGDIEQWMDENYVISLFQGVINIKILTLYRLHKCNKLNLLEISLREHQSVSLIHCQWICYFIGYGFVEFQTHDVAKNVYITLNNTPIPGT